MPNHLRRFVLKNNYTPLFVDQVRLETEYPKDTQHTVDRKDLLQHLVCVRSTPNPHNVRVATKRGDARDLYAPAEGESNRAVGAHVEHALYGLAVFLVVGEAKSS